MFDVMFLSEILSSAKVAPLEPSDQESLLAAAASITGLSALDNELEPAKLKQAEELLTTTLTGDVR